mmetsp:Transcript_42693/g.75145  ORF Transcript_42693/g.75145 Transcript_42693/m.75145 type:complete len:112 (+) Transcript_42693:471-806(+)
MERPFTKVQVLFGFRLYNEFPCNESVSHCIHTCRMHVGLGCTVLPEIVSINRGGSHCAERLAYLRMLSRWSNATPGTHARPQIGTPSGDFWAHTSEEHRQRESCTKTSDTR